MRDAESTDNSTNKQTGEKLCKDKYSSYPYCYDEIAMETKDNHHHHHGQNSSNHKTSRPSSPIENKKLNHNHNSENHNDNHNDTVQSLLSHNHLTMHDEKENNHEHNHVENNTVSSHVEDSTVENSKGKALVPEESYTIILRLVFFLFLFLKSLRVTSGDFG